jgi:hypothetical protein
MERARNSKKNLLILCLIILAWLLPLGGRAQSIDEVTFLGKIEIYETVVDTTIITQEGKRFPIARGTRLNVAGFTATEAFVISRMDKPNGFVRKSEISPLRGSSGIREETITGEPLK